MKEVSISSNSKNRYWLVSADMGYGHQRAIYPLKSLAYGDIILNSNTSPAATRKERRLWKEMLRLYELISRASRLPVIGRIITRILDGLLYIPQFYPLKDRSNSTLQVRFLKSSIGKGLCNGILQQMSVRNLPVITSFYASAIAADANGHEPVYCIICDTDLSRVWVAEFASASRIIYFAPGTVAAQRLHSYGVAEKNIVLTGFPLPIELLGNRNLDTLKINLMRRLRNLDPDKVFYHLYKHSINAFLHKNEITDIPWSSDKNILTITYVVGGAGAQKEIGRQVAQSLSEKIVAGRIKLNLVAGTRNELKDYFTCVKEKICGNNENVTVIWGHNNESYFDQFNKCLHNTDILWTKPSELSFYCALGLPIITTQPIGPQEKCNHKWLREIGAGLKQQNPESADQWLSDLLHKGRLAEASWNGFLKARKYGTYNILDFLETGTFSASNNPLKR
jgi:hypothetical protein